MLETKETIKNSNSPTAQFFETQKKIASDIFTMK
jgi:hypothetical protein